MRGCDVTVIHLMDSLMERQLDSTGGEYLKRRIESLGIRVMLPRQTAAIVRQRPRGRPSLRYREKIWMPNWS